MEYILALLWGIICFVAMFVASKFYVPFLEKRALSNSSGASLISSEEDEKVDALEAETTNPEKEEIKKIIEEEDANVRVSEFDEKGNSEKTKEQHDITLKTELTKTKFISSHPTLFMILMLVSSVFAAVCGYYAYEIASNPINIAKMTLTIAVLAVVFVTDIELMIIPNHLPLSLILGRIITVILEYIFYRDIATQSLVNSVITLIGSVVILLLLSFLTRGGIGMGDVKLFSALGFLCGLRALIASLLFAFVVGALFSTALLLFKKKKLKDVLPLGPCMLFGFGIAVLVSFV